MITAMVALSPALAGAERLRPHDLETLLAEAEVVVRADVLAPPAGVRDGLRLKVLSTLKGQAPAVLVAVHSGEPPVLAIQGEQGLFFLKPGARPQSKPLCIQSAGERWQIEPGSGEAADAYVRELLRLSPERPAADHLAVHLVGVGCASLRLASHAAQRLTLWAGKQPLDAAQIAAVEAFLGRADALDEVQSGIVEAFGGELPLDHLLGLAGRAPEDSRTRAALLRAAAGRASNAAPEHEERARGMLGAARASASPRVALAAAAGLAAMGDEAALPALAALLTEGDAAVRAEATLAVSELALRGSAAARGQLALLSDDSDPLVRDRADAALRALKRQDPMRLKRSRAGIALSGAAVLMLAFAAFVASRGTRR